jgi:hypothetical protein
MSGAVCPSCGVAVVPGYVRCPKCSKPLPRRPSPVVGGTALEEKRRFPVLALVIAAFAAIGVTVFFGLRSSEETVKKPVAVETPVADTPAPEPTGQADQPETDTTPAGPSAVDIAQNLEKALKRQRLWSTVTVIGGRVDVRSGSCNDKAMTPLLDDAAPSFRAAGLTKLRCLEQSGAVVTQRDL